MDVVETRVVGNHQSRFRLRARMGILRFDHKDTHRLLLLLLFIIINFEFSSLFFIFLWSERIFIPLSYNVRIISLNGQGGKQI